MNQRRLLPRSDDDSHISRLPIFSYTIAQSLWRKKEVYQPSSGRMLQFLVTLAAWPSTPKEAPNLKLIHLFSAGVDHFAHHPIYKETSIDVTTSSGIHGPPIAEWVLMTSLVYSKHYNITYEAQKNHQWGSNSMHLREGIRLGRQKSRYSGLW